MKWLFLVNTADFLFEFLGKVSHQFSQEGDEILIAASSKISEYEKRRFFPEKAKLISKADWCREYFDSNKKGFEEAGWRDLYTIYERFKLQKFNYQQSLDVINQFYQYLEFIFEKEKPDAVVGECPAGLFGLIAYEMCKKKGIPFIEAVESRIPERMDIWNLEYTHTDYEKTFNELDKNSISQEEWEFGKDFYQKFIDHKVIYASYFVCKPTMTPAGYISHYYGRVRDYGGLLIRYAKERTPIKHVDYESESIFKHALRAPFRMFKKNAKIPFQAHFFQKPNLSDKYFLFPMQYEPEASTLVLATYYSNQLATIKNVAMSLPLPYKLYLKEHPGSIGARTDAFYKEIKKLPNVVLLSSKENTIELIKNSAGVITMTSTAGMEAALAGKPVYVLGSVFYLYHPMCQKIVNFTDLQERMKRDIKSPIITPNLEEINIRFIIAYLRNTMKANMLLAMSNDDTNNYKEIAKHFKDIYAKAK